MSTQDCKSKYSFVYEIFKKLLSPEILYLGALFHDIGKGRKKDHSKVGSTESLKFCEAHGMSKHKSEMVCWLVENHLLMSLTIQKKDISDDEVIKNFADIVKTQERLDYLYLLTIADIRGTNPELYTDWKDSLLKELYLACKLYFRKNTFSITKPDRYIKNLKATVAKKLSKKISKEDFEKTWSLMNTDYFRRHSDDEIVWHFELIVNNSPNNAVSIRKSEVKGCSELTIYQNNRKNIFSYVANIIDNLNINIVDARIITLKNNQALDTYLLIDKEGKYIRDIYTLEFLNNTISNILENSNYKIKKITKKQTENVASFSNFINIDITKKSNNLLLEVSTLDHPGLLSKICESIDSCDLMVKDAKISTLGEEANDIFIVVPTNKNTGFGKDINSIKSNLKQKISELYN
jgi:[protein-PII] uridylyltransferase